MTETSRSPKLWRFTSKHPRYALGVAFYTLFAACAVIAMGVNNSPAAVVLALIPAPACLLLATAEIHRATHETKDPS